MPIQKRLIYGYVLRQIPFLSLPNYLLAFTKWHKKTPGLRQRFGQLFNLLVQVKY